MCERFKYAPILEESSGIIDNGKILSKEEVINTLNYLHCKVEKLEKELSEKQL